MKLSDFSTLVQLGIGLHLGSALFQFVAEFSNSPLQKKLNRLRDLSIARSEHDATERALDLLGDLETKSVQFFNDYRNIIALNCIIAFFLVLLLIWISVDAAECVPTAFAVFIIGLSVFPAPASIGFLWFRWMTHTQRLRDRAANLEKEIIYGAGAQQ